MDGLDLLGADDTAPHHGGGKGGGAKKESKGSAAPSGTMSDAKKAWITEGAMAAGAIIGAVAGVKIAKEHSVIGGIFGFLGGSILATVASTVALTRKGV